MTSLSALDIGALVERVKISRANRIEKRKEFKKTRTTSKVTKTTTSRRTKKVNTMTQAEAALLLAQLSKKGT